MIEVDIDGAVVVGAYSFGQVGWGRIFRMFDPTIYHLECADAIDPQFDAALVDGLVQHNAAATGEGRSVPLSAKCTGADGRLIGGLVGRTRWGWLYIERLYVDAGHRGCGIGAELVTVAEDQAIRRGCRAAHVVTFSFQARPFYAKLGYSVFAQLDDFPPGHTRFYMKKQLR